MSRAIFLDRDDTLIVNVPYLGNPALVSCCPGAKQAVQAWKSQGWKLVLVSNQSGVGRGLITKEQVAAVNREMYRQLEVEGFEGEYLCYASPEDPYGAEQRKPSPYLLEQAATDLDLDLKQSVMIGDKLIDVESGRRAGTRTVLVLTGGVDPVSADASGLADAVVPDVGRAAQWTLEHLSQG